MWGVQPGLISESSVERHGDLPGADSGQGDIERATGVSGGAYCSLFKTGHLKNRRRPFILSGDGKGPATDKPKT
jgi:hypothetical protein